ncbi:cyclophilin-like fold protein [Christensenella timonensis]|uniref:cyclophilin-like fold protein n=1 Tax=Christensenella timonensis TaxID=1816678 RepID=UPI0008311B6B|nr:cyclophilin-like fold protein [Christensenella timonensis]
MKKQIVIALITALMLIMTGCGREEVYKGTQEAAISAGTAESIEKAAADNPQASAGQPPVNEEQQASGDKTERMVIRVKAGEQEIVFQLNDSAAARELYEQLPLSVEVEDFGGTEKIFYPRQTLDVKDAPAASGEVGSLAYYEPWGDVVMFYGGIDPGSSLYGLGEAVAGGGHIQNLSGMIEIEKE